MKLILAATIATAASATLMSDIDMEFIQYVANFGKTYGTTEEFNFRRGVFAENLA